MQTCCCGFRRRCCACQVCVSKDIDGREAGTENWTVRVSLATGLLLKRQKIMIVSLPASLSAFGLSETKGATPGLGRDCLQCTLSDLPWSPVALTVHGEQHSCGSFIISPSSASHQNEVLWGDFRFARQMNSTHIVWAHLATGARAHPPSASIGATPGSRVGLG